MLSSLPPIRRVVSSSLASTSAIECTPKLLLVSASDPASFSTSRFSSSSTSLTSTSSRSPVLPRHHHESVGILRKKNDQRHYSTPSRRNKNRHHGRKVNYNTEERRLFATSSTETSTSKKKDLRESIERLKNESIGNSSGGEATGYDGGSSSSSSSIESNPYIEKITSIGTSFLDTLSQTWDELIASGKAKDINKKIGTATSSSSDGAPNYSDDDAAADRYESYKGNRDIMVIDPLEHLSAWERMERRLRDAPIIADILERSHKVYEESGAKARVDGTTEKIQHLREDAAEAWETSQNPWVYRASSVYDTLTAESEFAVASRQLQKLDPDFTLENWKRDVVEHTLPRIMKLFLEGRITELKPWLGEAVYNRLAAEARARKKEGVQMDTNVLAIMNAEILACEVEGSSVNVERGSDPIILLHFMCQQIHCVRKKVGGKDSAGNDKDKGKTSGEEDTPNANKEEAEARDATSSNERTYMDEELGDIVEGSEDDIRANSYVVAFQREYNEEKMELNWKIVDFRFNGAIAYL
jgi:import inner membrane translocase subunit TIM44